MTSDKRVDPAWKKQLNKIPKGEKENKTLNEFTEEEEDE